MDVRKYPHIGLFIKAVCEKYRIRSTEQLVFFTEDGFMVMDVLTLRDGDRI